LACHFLIMAANNLSNACLFAAVHPALLQPLPPTASPVVDEAASLRQQLLDTCTLVVGPGEAAADSEYSSPAPDQQIALLLQQTAINEKGDAFALVQQVCAAGSGVLSRWYRILPGPLPPKKLSSTLPARVLLSPLLGKQLLAWLCGATLESLVADELDRLQPQPPVAELQGKVDEAWASLVVRYGQRLHMVGADHTQPATTTAALQVLASLRQRWRGSKSGSLAEEQLWSADWVLATLFILAGGEVDLVRKCAKRLLGQLHTASAYTAFEGRPTLSLQRHWATQVRFGVVLDAVLELAALELPELYHAIVQVGLGHVSAVVTVWLEQWFWRVLDFVDVVLVTLLSSRWSAITPALVCLALLRSYEDELRNCAGKGETLVREGRNRRTRSVKFPLSLSLLQDLLGGNRSTFALATYLPWMADLERQYGKAFEHRVRAAVDKTVALAGESS
jgi:hypothetical protein